MFTVVLRQQKTLLKSRWYCLSFRESFNRVERVNTREHLNRIARPSERSERSLRRLALAYEACHLYVALSFSMVGGHYGFS